MSEPISSTALFLSSMVYSQEGKTDTGYTTEVLWKDVCGKYLVNISEVK